MPQCHLVDIVMNKELSTHLGGFSCNAQIHFLVIKQLHAKHWRLINQFGDEIQPHFYSVGNRFPFHFPKTRRVLIEV